MAQANALLYAFNRGVISPLALSRTDLKVQALSAQKQTNWMPRELGSMMLRPGLAYVDGIFNNQKAVHLQFMKAVTDTAIIELTNQLMRVRVNEQIITRPSVASATVNGNFAANLNNWINGDEPGATSAWAVGPYMSLMGNGAGSRAIRSQAVVVASGDQNKEHALRIVIAKGSAHLRVGTSLGDDSYVSLSDMSPGIYSLSFTPTGNFTIQITANDAFTTLVSSINVEAVGPMTIAAPWLSADLLQIRYDQSNDEIFIACNGYAQYKIERVGNARSWSLINYVADDGPFELINTDLSLTLAAGALTGDTTLTSSIPYFKASHLGSLFRLTSLSQNTNDSPAGLNQHTSVIEVTDVGTNRTFSYQITGTWSGTLALQRSVGSANGPWTDVQTFTANASSTYNDALDNQIIFYRFNFDTYVSGTANIAMQYSGGGITGIARVTQFNNNQSVNVEVLSSFGSTTATSLWSPGTWSPYNGYPSSVGFYEGRLWWEGNDSIDGSVSDAFASYDDTITGNSAPINRSIGSGPVENICWFLGLQRMLIGGEDAEFSIRSSYLDEPLTSTDFNIKSPSTRGSAKVNALKIDTNGVFVQRGDVDAGNNKSGTRLIEMSYQGNYAIVDYASTDLSILAPEVTQAGILKIAVQRKPDTRIHCLLADGTVAILVYDPVEKIKAWIPFTTNGIVEDIVIMPGGVEDKVYYAVNRTINGATVRYLEKWAMESECAGGNINKNADCHLVIQNGSPSTVISFPQLAGQSIVVWADGFDIGTATDSSGNRTQRYTLDASGNATVPSYTNAVVGLGYTAQFQSAKLAYAAPAGSALNMLKSVDHVGIVGANMHSQGLQYGPDFSNLQDMPLIENGQQYATGTIWQGYDYDTFEFPGTWDTDSRLCLQAAAPRPCTILSATIGMTTSERI